MGRVRGAHMPPFLTDRCGQTWLIDASTLLPSRGVGVGGLGRDSARQVSFAKEEWRLREAKHLATTTSL